MNVCVFSFFFFWAFCSHVIHPPPPCMYVCTCTYETPCRVPPYKYKHIEENTHTHKRENSLPFICIPLLQYIQ